VNIDALLSNTAVQSLGRALLHFLWQGALLAAALWLFNFLARRASAGVRYAAACLVMLLMPAMLVATLLSGESVAPASSAVSETRTSSAPGVTAIRAVADLVTTQASRSTGLLGWVVFFWLVGVAGLTVRAVGGWISVQRLKLRTHAATAKWRETLERLKLEVRVSRPVALCTSTLVRVPTVIGWLRPAILFPASAIAGLDAFQLEAILAHELAHIRRHDYLVNLLQTAVETLLFYHPAVWWVSRQMRIEREHCCDDVAVQVSGNALAYAGALARLEEMRIRIPEAALAATGGHLLGRIRRLLENETATGDARPSIGGILAAALVLCAIAAPIAAPAKQSQTPAPAPAASPVPLQSAAPAVKSGSEMLLQLYEESKEPDLKRHILDHIGSSQTKAASDKLMSIATSDGDEDLRRQAVDYIAAKSTAANLISLYETVKEVDVKRHVLDYIGASSEADAAAKLLSIAKSDPELDLRRGAIDYIAAAPNSIDRLISLYDEVREPDIKRHVLDYIGSSPDPKATAKLLSIVKSESDMDLRRQAVDYIASRP
jgi:beta-lactamase regulating signal transducer with metallopeptidase domain